MWDVRRWGFRLGLCALIALWSGEGRAKSDFLENGEDAQPVIAAARACPALDVLCAYQPYRGRPLSEAQIRTEMLRVHLAVNAEIIQVPDNEHRGQTDVWELPTDGMGDCEDLALEKMRRLILAGVPHERMRIAVVANYEGGANGAGHAVLLVRTPRGDMVLDTLNAHDFMADPYVWHRARYSFIKAQHPFERQRWQVLHERAEPKS